METPCSLFDFGLVSLSSLGESEDGGLFVCDQEGLGDASVQLLNFGVKLGKCLKVFWVDLAFCAFLEFVVVTRVKPLGNLALDLGALFDVVVRQDVPALALD